MRNDPGFIAFVHELLEAAGSPSTRAMFGGHGVYLDGVFVGLIIDSRLYLKADAQSEGEFIDAGCAPFVYDSPRRARVIEMSYYSVPDEALDSPEQMLPWSRLALAAALRKKPQRPRRG